MNKRDIKREKVQMKPPTAMLFFEKNLGKTTFFLALPIMVALINGPIEKVSFDELVNAKCKPFSCAFESSLNKKCKHCDK